MPDCVAVIVWIGAEVIESGNAVYAQLFTGVIMVLIDSAYVDPEQTQ
jgi:hypothetical protein